MARFEVEIRFEDRIVVLGLTGRLTAETTSILQTVMDTLVDVVDGIVFDFAGLDAVDDFGVEVLEQVMKSRWAAGWRVGVRNTRRDPRSITQRYGLRDLTAEDLVID